jgi:hypothetical protein
MSDTRRRRASNRVGARLATLLTSMTLLTGLVLPTAMSSASPKVGLPNPALGALKTWLPATGSLFGAAVFSGDHLDESTTWEADIAFEAQIQRPMTLERRYFTWDDQFPGANEYLARDMGRTIALSWGAGERDGSVVPWADIAAGDYDATIDARAADIKAFVAPMFFIFHHEPNGNHPGGTPEEFKAAFQHIHDRFIADGVRNVLYTMVMFDTAYDQGTINDYYPGDSYVDVLGVDAYNWYDCGERQEPWTSFHDVALAFHDFGAAHHKFMIIAEVGSEEDSADPNHKGAWITDMLATLKTWPDVKGVAWFNSGPPYGSTCNWWVDSSPASLAAFQAIGRDSYLNPPRKQPPVTNLSYVNVSDDGNSGANGYPAQGHGIKWLVQGPLNSHSITDNSGMGYFDSGTKAPGASYTFTFIAAGNYKYTCTLHPSYIGTIKVPFIVTPGSGNLTTVFTLQWATSAPPAGYAYDVQVLRPNQTYYNPLLTDSVLRSITFVADSGKGTYSFRSRLKKLVGGKYSNWSEGIAVVVS